MQRSRQAEQYASRGIAWVALGQMVKTVMTGQGVGRSSPVFCCTQHGSYVCSQQHTWPTPHALPVFRYHSHPVFEPCPSRKDMDNQRNYQALTRDSGSSSNCGSNPYGSGSSGGCCGSSGGRAGLEPFVGFILSPFDPALPMPHTSAKAFVVQQRGPANALVPFNIRCGLPLVLGRSDRVCREEGGWALSLQVSVMPELQCMSARAVVVQGAQLKVQSKCNCALHHLVGLCGSSSSGVPACARLLQYNTTHYGGTSLGNLRVALACEPRWLIPYPLVSYPSYPLGD
jgi:hypothetical protein